jgi:hypothetical protein
MFVEGDFGCRIEVAGGVNASGTRLGVSTIFAHRFRSKYAMTPIARRRCASGRAVFVNAPLPE